MTILHRFIDDVRVGETLPALDLAISLKDLVMYAGATWDFHRYHYDADFVAKLGLRAPFMDGQMLGALLARQLMAWGGCDAFVRKLSYRQRGMVFVGDRLCIDGRVSGCDVPAGLAHCTMAVTGGDGGTVARDVTATVELPRRIG